MPVLTTIATFSNRGFGGAGGGIYGLGWIALGASSNISYPETTYAISINSNNVLSIPGYARRPDASAGYVNRGILTLMSNTAESISTNQLMNSVGHNCQFNTSVVDASDNIYVGGKVDRLVSGSIWQPSALVTKYDSSGNHLWSIAIDSTSLYELGNTVDIDVSSSGNIFVGMTSFISPYYSLYIGKYNSSGVRQWIRSLSPPSVGSTYQDVISNIVDSSENVYTLVRRGDYVSVIKIDTSGTYSWSKELNVPAASGWNSSMSIKGTTLCIGVDGGFITMDTTTGNILLQKSIDISASESDNITTQVGPDGTIYCLTRLPLLPAALVCAYSSTGDLLYCNKLTLGNSITPTGMVYKNNELYITFYQNNNDIFVMKVPASGTIPNKGIYVVSMTSPSLTYTINYLPYPVNTVTTTYTASSTTLTFDTSGLVDYTLSLSSGWFSINWVTQTI